MTKPTTAHASLPPGGLSGLEPSWSRLVDVPVTDGVGRTWHVLDNQVANPQLTVLCVHGNPSWSYLYRNLVRSAPDGVRVIAVDQLEMGFSERSGRLRRLAKRVDDLCELTEAMKITGPVVTVAHDWGGPVSLGWAQRHLAQLVGVVLMNTAVHQPAGSPAPSLIRLTRSRPMLQNVTVRTTSFIRGALEMSDQRPPADVRRGFLAPYLTSARRAAIAEFVADIPLDPDHPSAATLDRIAADLDLIRDVPTLLLWGAKDKVFSDLYLHDLERRLPGADVHRYPDAGHFVSEDVDAVGAIVAWLGTLDRAADADAAASPVGDRASTLLDVHGELGDQLAVAEMTGGAHSITFGEFAELVESTAAGLVGGGIAAGDRVALMVPPGIDVTVTLYACWRAGAVIVLIDSGLGPSGMKAAIRAADPAHLIGIPKALAAARTLRWPGRRIAVHALPPAAQRALGLVDDLPALRRRPGVLPDPPTPTDLAAVVFTSGSTGPSKGVTYTHGQLEAQRDALADLYGITTDDRLVAAFAPFALFGPALGVSSIVPDMDVTAPGTLSAAALGDAVVEAGATMVFASPAALANVVRTADRLTERHRAAFAQVRVVLSAGAPVRASLLRSAADLFPNATAHTPYGMTECLPVASISLTEIEAGSSGEGVCVGRPLAGVDVRIRPLDRVGQASGPLTDQPDMLGEVVVRADHARSGYDRLWHTEFAASQPPGWHSTGDLGQLDGEGRLWIGGRLSDVIATADGPIAPVRIEHAIEMIDGVGSAAVVGVGPPGVQQIVAVLQPVDAPRSPRLADLELIDAVRDVTERCLEHEPRDGRRPLVTGSPCPPDGSTATTPLGSAASLRSVCAVFEVPELPVDRRHNSKIDRARVAEWAGQALAGGRLRRL